MNCQTVLNLKKKMSEWHQRPLEVPGSRYEKWSEVFNNLINKAQGKDTDLWEALCILK